MTPYSQAELEFLEQAKRLRSASLEYARWLALEPSNSGGRK